MAVLVNVGPTAMAAIGLTHLIGGLLLVGLAVPGMVAPLRAKNRHVALLREHGVRLDALGNEERFVRFRTERATRHFT
jgi:hypothetical protein